MGKFGRIFVVVFFVLIFVGNIYGETITGKVIDNKGKLVKDAVISATPLGGSVKTPSAQPKASIDQVNKTFIEYVTPVLVGTEVSFPNSDKIRHHVYSLSKTKKFEIPLYPPGKGPVTPIVFDKPGVVVLGCNVHDWMKAYVYILETPYFAKTGDNGKFLIQDIPEGKYKVELWHPRLRKSSRDIVKEIDLSDGAGEKNIEFSVKLRKEFKRRRAPSSMGGPGGKYR